MLCPEKARPVRIPRLFPIPTHIFKEAGSAALTATSGALYVVYSPRFVHNNPFLGYKNGAIISGTTFTA